MNSLTNFEQLSPFDQIRLTDSAGDEYWLARQLQPLLGYSQWRRFEESIERAKIACINSGEESNKHFLPEVAKSSGRPGSDYKLSRYGCYLTAMNGDPRKPEIALAQSYFAIKTREAELAPQATLIIQLQEQIDRLTQIVTRQYEALTSITQRLDQIEQRFDNLPSAKPKRAWTLPASTPPDEVPSDYQQLEDGSWLSPEAYQSILRQGKRALHWEIRKLGNRE